jgi:hypothetical protein
MTRLEMLARFPLAQEPLHTSEEKTRDWPKGSRALMLPVMLAEIMARGKSGIGSLIRPSRSVEGGVGRPVIDGRAFAAA